MSTVHPQATPLHTPEQAPPPQSLGARLKRLGRGRPWLVGVVVVVAIAILFVCHWLSYRSTHSITDDAFVEAHIINVAPQSVSGNMVRFLVEENDRVVQGQLLAEINPESFRNEVELARTRVETAEAELRRQEAALARLRLQVPIQIEIAQRSFASAKADQGRAQQGVKLTEDEVGHGIEEAQAGLDAANADLVLAELEYTRFTNLQREAAVTLRRAQEVTQARDLAEAHRKLAATKLAQARANQTQIEVAKQALEAAEKGGEKAAKAVELAKTGDAEIREAELLTAVKKQMVTEARRALILAQDLLNYTQVRAPISGVVVKLYRHLGDFASPGVPILSMYDPRFLYVTANLEETRLRGVAPGNQVELHLDAFTQSLGGRVVWVNKSTGAQFALMPRNVVSGEFTKVVQRIPIRIAIERDERWPLLRAGLSVRAEIEHGPGDAKWAEQAAREMAELELRYDRPPSSDRVADADDPP